MDRNAGCPSSPKILNEALTQAWALCLDLWCYISIYSSHINLEYCANRLKTSKAILRESRPTLVSITRNNTTKINHLALSFVSPSADICWRGPGTTVLRGIRANKRAYIKLSLLSDNTWLESFEGALTSKPSRITTDN
jgi:hypothetical protein